LPSTQTDANEDERGRTRTNEDERGRANMRSPAPTSSPLSAIRNREVNTPKDVVGVLGALEAVCELESRLRMAIKSTHPLDSVTWDFHAADRERKALLNIGYVHQMLCLRFQPLAVPGWLVCPRPSADRIQIPDSLRLTIPSAPTRISLDGVYPSSAGSSWRTWKTS
jgi:hypothetical protein